MQYVLLAVSNIFLAIFKISGNLGFLIALDKVIEIQRAE